jgi:hypothetical protein
MKPKSLSPLLVLTSLVALAVALPGCMTSKQVTPASPASTNQFGVVTPASPAVTNTVVNQGNLALDCMVLQGATTLAVSVVAAKDPQIVPSLQLAAQGLMALAQGANVTNTSAQIVFALGGQSTVAEMQAVTALVSEANTLRLYLLGKYGSTAGVQIGLALDGALANGFAAGLLSPPLQSISVTVAKPPVAPAPTPPPK